MLVKIKIIVSGGFHHVPEKTFLAVETDNGIEVRPTTACKMRRYVCGISGCTCGGLDRCIITDTKYNRLCVTYRFASGLPQMFDRIQDLVEL